MNFENMTTKEIEKELERRKNLEIIKENNGIIHKSYYVVTITESVERPSGHMRENNEEAKYYTSQEKYTNIYDGAGNLVKSFFAPYGNELTGNAIKYINTHLTPEAIQRHLEVRNAIAELENKLINANYNKDRVSKEIERFKGNVGIS